MRKLLPSKPRIYFHFFLHEEAGVAINIHRKFVIFITMWRGKSFKIDGVQQQLRFEKTMRGGLIIHGNFAKFNEIIMSCTRPVVKRVCATFEQSKTLVLKIYEAFPAFPKKKGGRYFFITFFPNSQTFEKPIKKKDCDKVSG